MGESVMRYHVSSDLPQPKFSEEDSKIIYDLSKLPKTVQQEILESPKYRKWFSEFPKKLFNVDNPKTVKGQKLGIRTLVQYLTPSKLSGVNLCAMSSVAKCDVPCLNTAGRGKMGYVQMARLRKTLFMLQYWEQYRALFMKEVILHGKYCWKHNLECAVRPNGTTDIRWELTIWEFMVFMYNNYDVQWYDYTKIPNRLIPNREIYDLTFSYSGVKRFLPYVEKAKNMGMRIAVVWRYKYQIPKTFMGMKVISGDEHDARYTEPHGVVSALYAKGDAIHDTSGFVVG